MSKVQIIGIPQSTYVRTVRIAAEEKGISCELIAAPPPLTARDRAAVKEILKKTGASR